MLLSRGRSAVSLPAKAWVFRHSTGPSTVPVLAPVPVPVPVPVGGEGDEGGGGSDGGGGGGVGEGVESVGGVVEGIGIVVAVTAPAVTRGQKAGAVGMPILYLVPPWLLLLWLFLWLLLKLWW